MHHWKETTEILARLDISTAAHRRSAIATVVRVEGSAYRRPGAKLLVGETGETVGGVSGGCLEADVCAIATAVIASNQPVLRHYDQAADDVVGGLGLGCNGVVDIFVQPAMDWPLASLRSLLAGDSPVALATVLESGVTTATLADHGTRTGVDRGVFTEILRPPPYLVVCGAGTDAVPLVAYAADVGFRVVVLDHREALLAPEAFPSARRRALAYPQDPEMVLPPSERTLAVVKTRSFAHDREWVRLLLGIGVPYIGVLGPKDRTERILREVCGKVSLPRVFAPVGLDLGADGPQQVAISIVAELLAFVADREPQHLWQRRRGIHDE
jgi:xanthine/CO dehydrogenase XdhC/CoxF family maturation factor